MGSEPTEPHEGVSRPYAFRPSPATSAKGNLYYSSARPCGPRHLGILLCPFACRPSATSNHETAHLGTIYPDDSIRECPDQTASWPGFGIRLSGRRLY